MANPVFEVCDIRLSAGMSIEEILADYQDLERDDIMAALDFAARITKIKRIEALVA